MPRDDLSIDFVAKMPQSEAADPAQILEDFFYRFQNIPEEIRFIQAEIVEKDKQVSECLRIIEDRDGKIQKWIKTNGSHTPNPKEDGLRTTIRENYAKAERLAEEKLSLTRNLQQRYDRHVLFLDRQIKGLYDRVEGGFDDPNELPSLLRPSAANQTAPLIATAQPNSNGSAPTTPITTLQNNPVPLLRAIPPTLRTAQSQQHTASAPATPAASMMLNHKVRESSAGPGISIAKRGPRISSGLANTPTTSSGLARHSSLGPGGVPTKATAGAAVVTAGAGPGGAVRAGSAGPRSGSIKTPTGSGPGRKGSPGGGFLPGRKKSQNPVAKSSLSRVKKASTKNNKSPASSTVGSDLSDAESGSGADAASQSDAAASQSAAAAGAGGPTGGPAEKTKRGSQRARSGTPGPGSQGGASSSQKSGVGGGGAGGGGGGGVGGGAGGPGGPVIKGEPNVKEGTGPGGPGHHRRNKSRDGDGDEEMGDADDDEAGDDKKYCLCQNVSFGDMVACDNDDCPYEWFHWSCVGLKGAPNGTWFCPMCRKEDKKTK